MMSSNNETSLSAALEARTSHTDRVLLSGPMIKDIQKFGENIYVTSMESKMSAEFGFTHLHVEDRYRRNLPLLKHIDQNQLTNNVLLNDIVPLGEGVYGVNRYEVEDEQSVKSIWGDDRYSIGDFQLETLCQNKDSFFNRITIPTVTDQMPMEPLGGVTFPTCQLSCGKSQLGDHIEHSGAGSVNILYDGAVKEWVIYSPSHYLSAISQMQSVQNELELGKFTGVCDQTLTHRDTRFDPPVKNCTSTIVLQEPGDIVIVHPSAIHNVKNHGTNIAESRNFLPMKYANRLATYKVCKHSESLRGNPLLSYAEIITKHMPLKDFIHESDPNKAYKLRLINLVEQNVALHKHKKAVRKQIEESHSLSSFMQFLLPFEKEEGNIQRLEVKKNFPCGFCEYSTINHSDLKKHVRRIHPGNKCYKNERLDVCPFCSGKYKQLRQHKKMCKARC